MKIKVKIVNVASLPAHPGIYATLINIESGRSVTYNDLPNIFRYLEEYESSFECVNLGKDRLGLPCVLDT